MATIEPYQTKGGRRWRVRYRTPARRQTDKRGFKTKRDAQAFAATVEVEKMRGGYISPTAGRATIEQIGTEWKAGLLDASESWRTRQLSIWETHVRPAWGPRYVGDVTAAAVQDWVNRLADKDRKPRTLSAKSIRHALGVLAGILDRAVAEQRLVTNPARGRIRVPRTPTAEKPYLSATQVEALSREIPAQYRTIFWVLASGGLRWGELAALRPRDILDNGRIRLNRAYSKSNGQSVLTDLKGHEARTVALPERVHAMVREAAKDRPPNDLIWQAPRRGGPLRPPTTGHWLDAAVHRCHEADARFPEHLPVHALRHTSASLMIASGAHVKTIQRQLGHKDAAMTLNQYGHLFEDDLDQVAEGMERLLFPDASGQNVGKKEKDEPQQA